MTVGGTVLIAVGVVLVAAGVTWSVLARRRRRRIVVDLLTSSDPARRRLGIDVASERGLSAYAGVLLGVARGETDPSVLEAMLLAVRRNLWEPNMDRHMVDLRLWAAAAAGGDDSAEASGAEGARDREDRMEGETITVLVTGAGGPAGVAVIRSLQQAGHKVVAADADPSAAGLTLGDSSGLLPPASAEDLVEAVCQLARNNSAQALISTVAEEIMVLSEHAEALRERVGLALWMPPADVVAACVDKWKLAEVARQHDLPFPPTALGTSEGVPGPWIVKPRRGRGSRDVHAVTDGDELAWALRRVPEPIVQSLLPGREFTVDALMDRDGELLGAVPRWRLETRGGISTKGETFFDAQLITEVGHAGRALRLQGPFNIQGFLDEEGRLGFTDVNPRFSGALPLSLAAGADLVGEYLEAILGRPVRPERLAFRPGVKMARFFCEVFEG
jgi:carbamoyl-phosphate synthase large subunit